MRTSSEINAEIYNYGGAFFEQVRSAITEHATFDKSQIDHENNRRKLMAAVSSVMQQAIPRTDLTQNDLWQVLWQRVVYAGTLASKATKEISSMKELIPLFQSLDNYVEDRYVFDKKEWKKFVKYWKDKYGEGKWLEKAKESADWNPERSLRITTPEVWKILIKDHNLYPNLKFSSLDHKVEKYIKIAGLLKKRQLAGSQVALHYYTDGYEFSPLHLTGQEWVRERQALSSVRNRFEKEVGTLTAMHTMMDLGLKWIKPDRVMTYLFSQLGWLQTLPNTRSKDEVQRAYRLPQVIEEMTMRADVLANRLDRDSHKQTHRLLDIWLVKYGQEPENSWGITVNLQKVRNIREILIEVINKNNSNNIIDAQTAAAMWPLADFKPIQIPKKSQTINHGDAMQERR